jgi:hypothetical protein
MHDAKRFRWNTAVLALALAGCVVKGDPGTPEQYDAPAVETEIQVETRSPAARPSGPASRPFLMGFTLWPADLTVAGSQTAQAFAYKHGDLVALSLLGGIPWTEAFDGKAFSKDVQESLSYRPPPGKKLFVSVSPLDKNRRALAPYWGEKENLALPKPFDKEPLNGARVKKAFSYFVLRVIEEMHPDYLAIAVESNVLLSRNPAKWGEFKQLYRDTRAAVKKKHPSLPVFFTTDLLHYKRLTRDAAGAQEQEVADLMRYSDLLALSIYPHLSQQGLRSVTDGFFDFAGRFKKPVAIAESGMSSRDVPLKSYGITLAGSSADQARFTEFLLETAARDGYEFVINFATTDSDKLVARLTPPADDLARIWAYTGMQTGDRTPKPALAVWDSYLGAAYRPVRR